nr:type II secretion system secretin GspD [Pseudohongiella sp. O18]
MPSAEQAAAERQALIDEINRDGRQVSVSNRLESVPSPVNPPDQNTVALNYEQADLREVLEELADALDLSIIIDPSIDVRVSLRTAESRPLTYDDVWPLIRLLTRNHGIILEQVGNVWYARSGTDNVPVEIATPDSLDQGTAAQIMQITPLRYVSAASATNILSPILDEENSIVRISNSNTLAITATRSQLVRINELLVVVDDDPFQNQGLQLYPLSNALASDVAQELTEILTMIEGENPSYQVKGLERINALLVTAPAARGFEELARWIRILDADREEQSEQLFQYRVKNLNAVELAETLSEVFRLDEEEQRPAGDDDDEAARPEPVIIINEQGEQVATQQAQVSGPASSNAGNMAVSANLRVSIVADEPTNSLLIRANPRDYRQLLTTISQLDTAPLQVMINAAIAQIVLTDETSFGVDWSRVLENADGTATRVRTEFLPSRNQDGSGGLGGLLFNRAFLDGAARVEATLEAIAINNDVRLLARPSLTVINNQEGLIRIGAEVPVQLGETIGVGGSTTNIQYRPTGIELQITPRINEEGVVNLTIRQELSSVSGSAGINQNPIFQNQEIETSVVVRDGENVVLGGLIQNTNDQLNTGVPYLNRVPGLGRLFSYQQDNNERTELFIVLRPEMINLNNQTNSRYQEILNRFELAAEMLEDI